MSSSQETDKQYHPRRALHLLILTASGLLCCESSTDKAMIGEVVELADGYTGLSDEALLDPESCRGCHPLHYAEWRASVHASAADGPVFTALNRLGQDETEGQLGAFCVQCHAPVALALGETSDGLNLSELPARSRGVTCAFCHQVTEITGAHNNPLTWTNDGVMRGGIKRPAASSAHRSQYSSLLDGQSRDSSALCGSCHDIVTPTGVHLERTFWEWTESIFSSADDNQYSSCGDCHMPSRRGQLSGELNGAGQSVSGEAYHDHLMPAVDLVYDQSHGEALETLTGRSLRDAVQRELDFTLLSELCVELGVNGGADVEVYLENVSAGHRFPSGAALDRRVWVELSAYNFEGERLFVSGEVPLLRPAVEVETEDNLMWLLRDKAYDANEQETHKFWKIESVDRSTLPPSNPLITNQNNGEDSHILKRYRFGTEGAIYELRLRVLMRPIGLEVLNELRDRGLLEQEVIDAMPTFELNSATMTWRADEASPTVTRSGRELLCAY